MARNDSQYTGAVASVIEVSNNGLGEVGELVERCNNLSMREVRGFVQAYLRGEFNLGLLYTLGDETNYGFIWSAAHVAWAGNGGEGFRGVSPARDFNQSRMDIDGYQSLMLSDNVEPMEGVKKVIPSLIRFKRFDDSSFLGGEGLYKFRPFEALASSEGVHKLGVGRRNGKVCVINERMAVAVCQGASENVKAASDSIDVGPRLNLECERQRLFFDRHHHVVRNIFWLFSDGYVYVTLKPSIGSLPEGWEFDYGPVDRGLSVE